jgi:hypothetical protein
MTFHSAPSAPDAMFSEVPAANLSFVFPARDGSPQILFKKNG